MKKLIVTIAFLAVGCGGGGSGKKSDGGRDAGLDQGQGDRMPTDDSAADGPALADAQETDAPALDAPGTDAEPVDGASSDDGGVTPADGPIADRLIPPDVSGDGGCTVGLSLCGAACVDTNSDAQNCGAC